MTVVRSRLLDASGEPLAATRITAEVYAYPPWTVDKTACVIAAAHTRTGVDGWWQLNIVPYSELEGDPLYTYVKVIEGVPGRPLTHWLRVPDSPQPQLMRDLLVDDPKAPPPWRPIPSLGSIANVDPRADHAADGSALLAADGRWMPGLTRLAMLNEVDADSLTAAQPGDPLVCLRVEPTGPVFGVDRPAPPPETLAYTMTRDSGDDTGHTIVVTIDSRDPAKTVGITWDGSGDEETVPGAVSAVKHFYEAAGRHRLTIRYTDDSESYPDFVDIPWKAAA